MESVKGLKANGMQLWAVSWISFRIEHFADLLHVGYTMLDMSYSRFLNVYSEYSWNSWRFLGNESESIVYVFKVCLFQRRKTGKSTPVEYLNRHFHIHNAAHKGESPGK